MDKYSLRDASLPQPLQSDSRGKQFWDGINSQLSSPPAAAAPKRDLDTEWSDYPKAVGAGALELVGGIGELARGVISHGKENGGKTAWGNVASAITPLMKGVAATGDLAQSGADALNESMSADAKEALGRRLVDETPEGRLTLGDGAGDIDVWAMKMAQGVGSLLPTLAAGGVTGVAAKASIGRAVTASMVKRGATQEVAEAVAAKAVSKIATGAAVTTGATGSVGSAGVNTRDTVLGMSFDELAASDTFRQSFTRIDQDQQTAHLSDEEKLGLAREETANLASRATMSDAKVWGAAAMGSMMGDAMLFKMLAGKAATGGVLKGAAKGAAGEGISETLEEGVQQYAVNESLNEVAAADIDPMKGVMSSAIEGGLIGMGAGGAVGAVGGARGGKHASAEEGGGADPVAEPSAPVTEDAAGPAVDPNFASAPLEDGEQVPSASQAEVELNPLGPSASQFDELRDVPAYLRRDDTAERFKGMAADSEVQRALAGEFGQSVQELVASQMQAGDQGKSFYERAQAGELGLDPFAGNKSAQQVAMENQRPALPLKDVIFAGDANAALGMTKEGHFDDKQAGTGPQFRGAERTRWQSGQEGDVLPPESSSTKPAGELPGAVIEGEAREVGTELPHRDVVYGADQRQPDAKPMRGSATESAVGPLKTLRITRKGKPFATEKEATMASRKGQEMPVPLNGGGFGVAEIAEVEQVKAAATTQSSAPQLDDISVTNPNQPSDQPAASVSAETVPAPSATAGEASQLAPAIDTGYREVIPGNQPQAEVSNEPVTPVPAISSEGQGDQPGAGEPTAAGAGPAVAGLADRAGSGDPADYAAAPPVPDGQQQDDPTLTAPAPDAGAAVSGRIGEEELRDRDLLKEHGGHWKYRSAVGAGWFTANTKEAAIERAEEAYRKAVSKGEPVPTRDERFAQADAELFSEMDRRYGKMSTPELEAEYQRLGGEVGDLQKSGSGEFNGNGGRRTGAAVSNEGARQVGEERLRLGVYMKMRRDRDTAGSGAKSQQIEPANDWRGGDLFGLAGARNNHGAAPSVPRSGDASAAKGAGGVTEGRLELDGVSIRIPAIDEEQQRLYNQATHRGQGVNFASGISTGVGRILNDLKDAGLLDTAEQRAAAEAEVQAWANEEAINARKLMRDGIKNPSWAITGRSGRKAQSSAAQDAENRRQAAHHKDQSDRITALRGELKKLRPKEVIGRESFNYAWGKAKGMIAEYASALSNGQPNLLASLRKSMNAELARYLQSMGKIDAPNFIKTLKEQDQRLKAAGHDGLVAIVGARSSPGKIISNAIDGRIRFSKQAMAQGEKPAKHLTRKEAELVTKEWFKQYRGASGIDVQIHATQAELEKALGLAAQDGLIRRAAFDDDSGTLHVAADTIANPKRMREILRHEVLAHYGLANVLGDGEYTKLMSRLIQSQKDPSMKPVWDWVNTHYADEDIGTQAEEVVAHLAEVEQGAWGRGWDRVVAWVTRALRAVGFVPDGITAAETRSLIEGLGKKLQRSGPDDSGPDGGKKFSQEAERPANDGGIKMSQSVADNSPSLEQSITQKAKYQAGAALGSVKNYIKQKRPVMLGTLTDLQIDQVYRDITGGAVSEYQRLRTQMEADRNDILLDAETRIDPLWDALDKQVKTALSNLMHDATMARLHPDKSLDENSYYLEAKQKVERAKKPETKAAYEAELHIIERNHSELARQYNALPANAKALYDTMQDTYTKQWESLRGAIEQRLEDLLGVNQGRAMAAEMRQKMEHALQHGPYFPLTRYGDYVVKARKGDEYVREHFERRADAEQAVKQYQRDGYNAVMTVKEEGGGDSANANQLGMEMLSFLDSADGVSKSALKDEIWQAMLRMMPDASYAKHAIHRRRVKGASRDAHRAYLNSVYHYARHVSKIRYGHKMQGELDKLSEQIRAGVAGEPSSLKPEDLEIAQQVLNEMNKRHDLNMNPTGKAWAGSAGNIGFLYYIGPSVASAVVNMTQNFTVMLPQLGAKYGFAKSAAAMTQALGDYVKHGKFKAGTTEAWHSLTRSTTLPADERAILDRLYRAGALDLTQAHSIAAKADTDQQDAKPMGKRWRRAMRWAGATFHNAEVLNREVAALAAYRLLKQAEPTLNGQQYADRVAEMVYDGHGNYAASNRPRYMRNDITKVLTQFKIYSQMMTYVLYSNAIKAAKAGSLKAWKKGVLGKELTQDDLRAIADGKLAAKTLGGVLATHWVMAGVMGLPTPLTFAAYAIAAGLDDDDDRSGEASFRLALTEALGPRAGELLAKGPMDALTNLSIAGRTGLGDLWWRSPKEGTEGDDLAWHAVQQLLGPVAGIGINLARGAGQMTDGHIQRGLETMLPKSIRDVAKSYRQATEGEQTIKGDIIMDDVSTWNVAMQGLGFGSAQMAKNYDAREYIKGKEKRIADKRSQLLTDYYMARKSGEMDEVQEVLERIKMFNSIHHPRERITGKSLALSFKSKLRSNERTQGGVYLNRNREYLREEGRFAD
ncbi:PLxRFG domain-containing protein [Aeromonas veronii]|uniref:PLxRFG domain-containing protein n=1 Tax=Aeromonas veronii TaxID=654 RepID=UPI00389B1C75